MRLNKSSVIGLATAFCGGLILYYISRTITDLPFDALGASFFPKVAAVGMVLFGAILFITSAWGKREEKREKGYSGEESVKIFCFLVSLFLYVLFLPTVGFLILTTLLMLVIFLILTEHWSPINVGGAFIFSILCTFFLWYVFTRQFDLILP